jgi:hypothetical protein
LVLFLEISDSAGGGMVHSILLVHCWGFTSQTTGCRSNPHETTIQMDPEAMRAVNDAITACWGHLLGKTWQGPDFFIGKQNNQWISEFVQLVFRATKIGAAVFQRKRDIIILSWRK